MMRDIFPFLEIRFHLNQIKYQFTRLQHCFIMNSLIHATPWIWRIISKLSGFSFNGFFDRSWNDVFLSGLSSKVIIYRTIPIFHVVYLHNAWPSYKFLGATFTWNHNSKNIILRIICFIYFFLSSLILQSLLYVR